MRGQTTLTGYLSAAVSRGSSVASSHAPLTMPSPAPSHASSVAPSPMSSVVPSPVPSSVPSTSNLLPVPEELSQTGSGSDSDGDIAEWNNEPEGGSDSKEEDMDDFLDISGAEPRMKETICDWHEL